MVLHFQLSPFLLGVFWSRPVEFPLLLDEKAFEQAAIAAFLVLPLMLDDFLACDVKYPRLVVNLILESVLKNMKRLGTNCKYFFEKGTPTP